MSTSPVVQLQAQLHRPDAAGEWIKKLRGFVSLTVSRRRPHPLVIPLVNAAGKTFENQDHRLTVHDIRPTPTNHNVLIELSIKANDAVASSDRVQDDVFSDGFPARRSSAPPDRSDRRERSYGPLVPIGGGRRERLDSPSP